MNKLHLILLGLVMMMAIYVARADNSTELVNELEDEEDDGEPDGGVNGRRVGSGVLNLFAGRDVQQDGVEKVSQGVSALCASAKSLEKCETCCDGHGYAGTFTKTAGIFRKCTCSDRLNSF